MKHGWLSLTVTAIWWKDVMEFEVPLFSTASGRDIPHGANGVLGHVTHAHTTITACVRAHTHTDTYLMTH